jgi:IS30 family transposase
MPGSPLSLFEREEIGVALIEDRSVSWAETGRRTGGYATTISREVTENGSRRRACCERSVQIPPAPTGRARSAS